MHPLLARLPAFALPFVTRSLRRGRAKRFVALSVLLASLTMLFALWMGLGGGQVAREFRVEIGVEESVYLREHREFVVIVSEWDDEYSLEARRDMIARNGVALAAAAANTGGPIEPALADMRSEAGELVERQWRMLDHDSLPGFSWNDARQIERLAAVIEHEGVPPVVDYAPALGVGGTLRLLGMMCAGILLVLMTLVAPILVALAQATERHENTLQPLTGTGLRARELALGLAMGPLAVVAIFAIPLTGILLATSLLTGEFMALVGLGLLGVVSLALVFAAQLLGHLGGSKRTPGLIAVALLALLSALGMIGLAITGGFERELVGFAALIPHVGVFALFGDAFADPWRLVHHSRGLELGDLARSMIIGATATPTLGLVALRATTRSIEGQATLLRGRDAFLAAIACIAMVDTAIPAVESIHHYVALPMLAMPFTLLIMARVPLSDTPSKLRRIPLRRLLGEFALWTALHLVVAVALDGTFDGVHPIALAGTAWAILVMVTLAIRLVATPPSILSHAWALFCLGVVPSAFFYALFASQEPRMAIRALSEVPAMLALTWVLCLAWVPVSLVRHLSKHVGALR